MEVAIWLKALRTMPRLSPEQWERLDIVARWLVATRASVLLMTLSSALIGGVLAWRDGYVEWSLLSLVVLGLMFAHACNNLVNDFTDSLMGIDKDNYFRNQYGVHVLESGLVSRKNFLFYIIFTAAVALAAGVALVWLRGGLTLWLMLAGAFFVLFYTWPLKYIGLGEPAVLLVWGPLMIGGSYYVISGVWSWPVSLISLCYALGPTMVLFGKHIDKLEADKAKGVRSLPVLLGFDRARGVVVLMLGLQYVLALALWINGILLWPILLVLANLPLAWRVMGVFRNAKPELMPAGFPEEVWPLWYAPFAFDHTRKFSAWFLLALLLEIYLRA
jgi:1,4-dihydroxy-2-naphthoate octaprenyltransferase